LITVAEAITTILKQIKVLGTERVDILSSLGRVLGEEIIAPFHIPPLDNSAMDGYAVRGQDVQGATSDKPVRLKILGDLPAGYTTSKSVGEGETFRIMTGAPIPAGADTVVMQEDTQGGGDTVAILKGCAPGTNIREAGEDIRKGEQVLSERTLIRPAHIGVLASMKKAAISVYQRPLVVILSTGDELIDIDEEMAEGKIVSSNSYSLASLVKESGAVPIMLGIARDTMPDLKKKFQEGLRADMLVSSGGVSVGDYDFVKDVLQDIGIDMKFWKVAMRPGQPLTFGLIEGKPMFGLPGNPVSAMVSFEQFVRPSIRKMSGHRQLFRPLVEATAQEKVTKRKGRKYFLRCLLTKKEGRFFATTTGEQGSGILMSMAKANGLMILPEDQEVLQAGETAMVQVLEPEFDTTEEPYY
jgi:molybdopterin molybdotransferase